MLLRATIIHNTRTPLLFAVVLGVVVLAAFSPVFSQRVEADVLWVCDANGNGINQCSAISDLATCNAIPGCEGKCVKKEIDPNLCTNRVDSIRVDSMAPMLVIPPPLITAGKIALGVGATYFLGGMAWDAAIKVLVQILQFINNMLVLLVGLVARLLDSAFLMSLAGLSGIDAITIGWGITRDVANIFFIFILLIIAIATILRLESYGAKQLLPKLIIVALLINFSLVIATTIVDASNILAFTFISRITPVSDKLAIILQINKITDTSEDSVPPSAKDIDWKTVASVGYLAGLGIIDQAFTTDEEVMKATPLLQNKPDEYVIQFFWQATILVLILTLIFVFVAISVMLLIRNVALIVIFVLAPLGFLAAILPATRGYANQWWHKLFQWSFFFPASAFMIYLAIAYGAQMSQYVSQGNHVVNMGMLFNYFATVAILIGSLIVAKQMGIVGAAAAIDIGLGAAKSVRGYAGRQSLRYGVGPAGAVAGFIPQQLGRIPFVGAPFRLMGKPFAYMQRKGAEVRDKQYDDIKKRVGESKSANLAYRRTLTAPGAIRAANEAIIDKGHAEILPQGDLRNMVQYFKREKDSARLRKLYAYDPSLAMEGEETPVQQAAAVSRAVEGISADDIRTKTNPTAVRDAFVADAMILKYGMQKLEAVAEISGEQLAPALRGAFERLREKNMDKILEGTGRTRTTATADDNRNAYDEAIKQLNKENPDVLKFINRSQTINMEPAAPRMLNLADTIRTGVKVMNDAAEKEAEDALMALEARRGGGAPSAQEIAQAKKGARKIEI